MITDMTTVVVAVTAAWFSFSAVNLMIKSAMGEKKLNASKATENKILPHRIFWKALILLSALTVHVFLVYSWMRAVLFIPFMTLVFCVGYVFQQKHNPDQIT